MTTKHPDWDNEAQRLERVIEEIDQRMTTLTAFSGQMRSQAVEIRRDFWEDVTVNFDDPHEVAETYTSIRQQAEILSEKERGQEQAEEQLRTLARLRDTTYFGRIDFVEEGERETDQVYLGIGSFRDQSGSHHWVYDWRAPISSLYYDYQTGPVAYMTPSGRIRGNMTCKRQYVIRDGQLITLFDADVTIGDELLREVLGQQADGQMKSIVATIQAEQNRIIRNERSRLIVVQGAAGSGKTSTALQRVAYLLYRHRQVYGAEHIVMFSPNPIFKSFVSTVLPELGEENIRQTTFQEYLEHRLARLFDIEDPFDQFEYVQTAKREPDYAVRRAAIQFKSSTRFMRLLDAYIDDLGQSGMAFLPIQFRGRAIVSREQITQAFYDTDGTWSIPNRIHALQAWLLDRLRQFAQEERSAAWVDEEIELLEPEDYNRAYQALRKRRNFTQSSFQDHQRERDALADLVIRRHLKQALARVKGLKFVDVRRTYYNLFDENSRAMATFELAERTGTMRKMGELTRARMREGRLFYEDATPFLYLMERLLGFQSNLSIRHVFIDEAQDYTPFQFVFIQTLFPRSRVTALGDINQAIYRYGDAADWVKELHALYGESDTQTVVLRKSYRSTKPIIEFARQIVRNGEQIEAFERTGPLPEVNVVNSTQSLHQRVLEKVLSWQRAGYRHIAVLCKSASESELVYGALRDKGSFQLIGKDTSTFRSGIVVIPISLAKGVEFDAVVVYDASAERYGEEDDRTLLYTACTRAMHELALVAEGSLSPFVPSANGAI